MRRLGLGWLGDVPARDFASAARSAEERGFASVWLAETRFLRDAVVTATAVALATESIQIGTAAVNAFTRGAVLTAVTFAGLDELSGGRIVAGIGPGSPQILAAQGYGFDRPVTRLREFVAGVRATWRAEAVEGRFVRVDGARVEFPHPRSDIPVYLAVTGPRALELAGEVGDGVILNAFTSSTYTRRACLHLSAGARRAGRSVEGYPVTGALVVAMDDERSTGRDALRGLVATYLTGFPNIAQESGLAGHEIEHYRSLAEQQGLEAAASRLPGGVIDMLTVNGPASVCRARIQEYRDAGLTEPILFAIPRQLDRVFEELSGA